MKREYFQTIIKLDKTTSTNDYLKQNLDKYKNGTVVFAKYQTAGRGRLERKWEGKKNCSIFASFLLKEINNPLTAIRFIFLFSLAVKQMLSHYIKDDIVLKWPNDILIGKKKICGILSEYINNSIIIGIGINVLNFKTSIAIKNIVTSIENHTTQKISLKEAENIFLSKINHILNKHIDSSPEIFPLLWFEQANIKNKQVEIKTVQKTIFGIVISISDIGELIIKEKYTNSLIHISAGDIKYLT